MEDSNPSDNNQVHSEHEPTAEFPIVEIGSQAPNALGEQISDDTATTEITPITVPVATAPMTPPMVENIPVGRHSTMLSTIDEEPARDPHSRVATRIGLFAAAACLLLGGALVAYVFLSSPPEGKEDFGSGEIAAGDVVTTLNQFDLGDDGSTPTTRQRVILNPLSPTIPTFITTTARDGSTLTTRDLATSSTNPFTTTTTIEITTTTEEEVTTTTEEEITTTTEEEVTTTTEEEVTTTTEEEVTTTTEEEVTTTVDPGDPPVIP